LVTAEPVARLAWSLPSRESWFSWAAGSSAIVTVIPASAIADWIWIAVSCTEGTALLTLRVKVRFVTPAAASICFAFVASKASSGRPLSS
jgi:hypothetical protein